MAAAMILEPYLAGVDSTVVAVALPAIGRNLHVGIQGLQWTVPSYMLPLAAVTNNVAVRAEAVSNTLSRRVTQEDALDELRGDAERPVRAVPGHQLPGFQVPACSTDITRARPGFGRRDQARLTRLPQDTDDRGGWREVFRPWSARRRD
jgi:hypothetical protein